MKKLLKMFDVIKLQVKTDNMIDVSPSSLNELIHSQPFVIEHQGDNADYDEPEGAIKIQAFIDKHTRPIDIPFPIFSVEYDNGDPFLNIKVHGPDNKVSVTASVDCIIVKETSPREYELYLLTTQTLEDGRSFTYVGTATSFLKHFGNTRINLKSLLDGYVAQFLHKLNTYTVGHINDSRSYKFKDKSEGKKRISINNTIYLKKGHVRENEIHSLAGRTIDWSYRFSVRGHWRKFDGIGKDREGVRCKEGFTWVKEHVRGPEDAPLVMKQRILND